MLAKEIINISGGLPQAPYIIAEAGVNHEGSMSLARRLIEEAAEAGADAIKFQTYRADSIAVRKSPAYWDLEEEPTTSQHELFSKYDKFWKSEFEQLKSHCDKTGIEFLSTPFDIESAIFLNDLMGAFKISSSFKFFGEFINSSQRTGISSFILLLPVAAIIPKIPTSSRKILPEKIL